MSHQNIIVVNGESFWNKYFPEFNIKHRKLQESKWVVKDQELWVIDGSGTVTKVDGVLWRGGAKPHRNQRTVLEMIRYTGIPCVNSPDVLLSGHDRLSMLNELKNLDLPLIPFDVVVGDEMLKMLQPKFPVVVKFGNYHAGAGKILISDKDEWLDLIDLAFITEDYITIEPYIDYVRDIRCLAIKDNIWAVEREGMGWKANRRTIAHQIISPPEELEDYTNKIMNHFKADILGIDFIENYEGEFYLLESNDIPGLTGFPEKIEKSLSECLIEKFT